MCIFVGLLEFLHLCWPVVVERSGKIILPPGVAQEHKEVYLRNDFHSLLVTCRMVNVNLPK